MIPNINQHLNIPYFQFCCHFIYKNPLSTCLLPIAFLLKRMPLTRLNFKRNYFLVPQTKTFEIEVKPLLFFQHGSPWYHTPSKGISLFSLTSPVLFMHKYTWQDMNSSFPTNYGINSKIYIWKKNHYYSQKIINAIFTWGKKKVLIIQNIF